MTAEIGFAGVVVAVVLLAEIGARGRRRGSEDDKQGKSRARAEFKNVDLADSDLACGASV